MITLVSGTTGVHIPHPLHGDERTWPETNANVDLWIAPTQQPRALGVRDVTRAA
jgi:hypothetical protein